jgi:hypothetical protein
VSELSRAHRSSAWARARRWLGRGHNRIAYVASQLGGIVGTGRLASPASRQGRVNGGRVDAGIAVAKRPSGGFLGVLRTVGADAAPDSIAPLAGESASREGLLTQGMFSRQLAIAWKFRRKNLMRVLDPFRSLATFSRPSHETERASAGGVARRSLTFWVASKRSV